MIALRTSRPAIVLVALLVVFGACGGDPDRTVLGARRVALDLAYSDESLRAEIPPEVIVRYLPALPEDLATAFPGVPRTAAPPMRVDPCPKAPSNAIVEVPAPAAFAYPPVAGTYLQRNSGTIKVEGPITVEFPYPPITEVVIRDVETVDVPDSNGRNVRTTAFVVEDRVTPEYRVVSRYSYDPRLVNLVEETVVSGDTTTTFTPSPALQVFPFTGPGETWTVAGSDTDALTSRVIQGETLQPEPVDICGVLVDAQRAALEIRHVDLETLNQSGTKQGQPSITHYATQFGGLPIRREAHTEQVVQTDAGPVTIETDVVSTFVSLEPVKK